MILRPLVSKFERGPLPFPRHLTKTPPIRIEHCLEDRFIIERSAKERVQSIAPFSDQSGYKHKRMAFRLRFSISACRWLERDDCRLHVVPAWRDVIEEFGSAAATQNRAIL